MTPPPRFAASLLRASCRAYATAAIERMRATHGELVAAGLPRTFAEPIDDTEVRILQLAASVDVDRPLLMEAAIDWYKVAFHHRHVPAEYLGANLSAIDAVLQEELPAMAAFVVSRHLAAAIRRLGNAPLELPTELSRSQPHGDLAMRFLLEILEARGDAALDIVRNALQSGLSVEHIQDHVLVPVLRETGRMWLMAEIPIADEHYGSAVIDRALGLLHERLPRPKPDAPVVLTMGVSGNLHAIGVRIVAQRLQSAGFAVHHLGSNMPAADLEWALQDRRVDLIAMSASLTLHLPALIEAVGLVRRLAKDHEAGERHLPVLVGGPMFGLVPDLHTVVGADAGADDARGAVEAAQRLLSITGS